MIGHVCICIFIQIQTIPLSASVLFQVHIVPSPGPKAFPKALFGVGVCAEEAGQHRARLDGEQGHPHQVFLDAHDVSLVNIPKENMRLRFLKGIKLVILICVAPSLRLSCKCDHF